MKEIWKDVKGYEGIYQVSDQGNVKSLDRLDTLGRRMYGMQLKPRNHKDGYRQVMLYNNTNKKHKLIHRVVGEAFIPNPLNLLEINHKDENKQNNCIDNLEWCTHKYNINYGTGTERSAAVRGRSILQKSLSGEKINIYASMREASIKMRTSPSNISGVICGKRKSARGYIWEYAK